MRGLSPRDVKTFNEAVVGLHATRTMEEFSGRINDAMRSMMTGEICAVNWVDRRTNVALSTIYHPAAPVPEEINTLAQTLLAAQTPFWLRCADEPRAASDYMSRAAWARKDIYWACRELSKEEFICFDVPLTSTLMLTLAEMRGRYGRYSPAERLKLKLLGPHLQQIHRRLAAPTERATGDRRTLRVAQTSVSPARRCEWTKEARGLLADYGIVVQGRRLPDGVKEWFAAQRSALDHPGEISKGVAPLRFSRGSRVLTFFLVRNRSRDAYRLLLQEKEILNESDARFRGMGLSRREKEVLFWLTQGKSNPEIALILGVSPGTIKRHLENILPKLGVENRYAAGLMAAQLLDAEARAGLPVEGGRAAA